LLTVLTDFEPQLTERAHIDVGDEHQREERDDVAAPIVEPQVIPRKNQKSKRDVVAEAVLAGEEIEELSLDHPLAGLAAPDAVFTRLAEDFLMGHGPCHARNRNGEDKEHPDLHPEAHRVQLLSAPCQTGSDFSMIFRPGA